MCPFVRRRPKNVGARFLGGARQERFYERWLPLLSAAAAVRALAAADPAAGRLKQLIISAPQRTGKSMGGSTRLKSAQDGWEFGGKLRLSAGFSGYASPAAANWTSLRAPGRGPASDLAPGWLPPMPITLAITSVLPRSTA